MKIKAIVQNIRSKRDINGNTYTYFKLWNPEKGRSGMIIYADGNEGALTLRHYLPHTFNSYEDILEVYPIYDAKKSDVLRAIDKALTPHKDLLKICNFVNNFPEYVGIEATSTTTKEKN